MNLFSRPVPWSSSEPGPQTYTHPVNLNENSEWTGNKGHIFQVVLPRASGNSSPFLFMGSWCLSRLVLPDQTRSVVARYSSLKWPASPGRPPWPGLSIIDGLVGSQWSPWPATNWCSKCSESLTNWASHVLVRWDCPATYSPQTRCQYIQLAESCIIYVLFWESYILIMIC